jgi:SNF2 family DNA or RNA helicase
LGDELMPFQRVGVAFLQAAKGRAILGDEMGLGKTVQALAWLQLHPELRPAVVVCPASLKINWQRETARWLTIAKSTAVLSGTKPSAKQPRADVYIVNYDVLNAWMPWLTAQNPAVLIADEAHYIKTAKAQRTKSLRTMAASISSVLLLTGTPVMNRPAELWTLLNTVAPTEWPDFFQFAKRFCDAKLKEIRVRGGGSRMVWDFSGAANLFELHTATRRHMVRRLKKDVLTELPEKRRSVIPFELEPAERAAHNRLLAETQAAIREAMENDEEIGGTILAQIEALKQDAVKGKLAQAIEWLRDFTESEKIIVFATHHFVVDALMAEFGASAVEVTGDTSQTARQAAVDRFQTDETCRLFVGNIKAAGVGITLTAASNVAFLELAWTPADHDQAEDRAHRIGQRDSVTAWYLLAVDTIEESIFEKLEGKRKIVGTITDGTTESDLVFGNSWRREIAQAVLEQRPAKETS